MEVKDAVLGALAMAGIGALATGAFQPISEVVYGVSDKLVNAYVPKSLRKSLPNSSKSILPMKFDITNTPKARARFDRDKDRESWNLIKEDLDKLPLDEILKYNQDSLDKKYQDRFYEYKKRRSYDTFSDHSEHDSNISEDVHEKLIPVDSKLDKKKKLKKGLIIGGTGAALTGIAALGIHDLLNNNNRSRTIVIPPFEVARLGLEPMNMSNDSNIVDEMGLDQPVDLSQRLVDHESFSESNSTSEKAKTEKKHKLKKALKIVGGVGAAAGLGYGLYNLGKGKGIKVGSENVLDSINNVIGLRDEYSWNHFIPGRKIGFDWKKDGNNYSFKLGTKWNEIDNNFYNWKSKHKELYNGLRKLSGQEPISFSESNSTSEEAKAEKKRKLKKGLKIAGGIALGTGALGAAALGATIGTPVFLLSRLTKHLEKNGFI